jgi:hypothetical protein
VWAAFLVVGLREGRLGVLGCLPDTHQNGQVADIHEPALPPLRLVRTRIHAAAPMGTGTFARLCGEFLAPMRVLLTFPVSVCGSFGSAILIRIKQACAHKKAGRKKGGPTPSQGKHSSNELVSAQGAQTSQRVPPRGGVESIGAAHHGAAPSSCSAPCVIAC